MESSCAPTRGNKIPCLRLLHFYGHDGHGGTYGRIALERREFKTCLARICNRQHPRLLPPNLTLSLSLSFSLSVWRQARNNPFCQRVASCSRPYLVCSRRAHLGTPWRVGNAERTSFFYFCCAYLPGNLRRGDAVALRKPRPLLESLRLGLYLSLSDPKSSLVRRF